MFQLLISQKSSSGSLWRPQPVMDQWVAHQSSTWWASPLCQSLSSSLCFYFLLFYLLILTGNALILVAVVIEPSLQAHVLLPDQPLPALDILFTTTTVPKMLSLFLFGDHFLSFSSCLLQMYLFQSFTCSRSLHPGGHGL